MNTKHTDAPWQVMYTTDNKNVTFLSIVPEPTQEGEIVRPICKVSPVVTEDEIDKANAKVIAASPEALRELNNSNEVLKSLLGLLKNNMAITTIYAVKTQIAENEAVIKKATE